MKPQILRLLVGLFPAYLCLYADGVDSALCILIILTGICAAVTFILTDENNKSVDPSQKLTDILRDLWIYHLSGFAICIFIHSL